MYNNSNHACLGIFFTVGLNCLRVGGKLRRKRVSKLWSVRLQQVGLYKYYSASIVFTMCLWNLGIHGYPLQVMKTAGLEKFKNHGTWITYTPASQRAKTNWLSYFSDIELLNSWDKNFDLDNGRSVSSKGIGFKMCNCWFWSEEKKTRPVLF